MEKKFRDDFLALYDPDHIRYYNKIRENNITSFEQEKVKYKEALGNYDFFIGEVVDLLKWLGYSSSLELGNMIAYLIENGYLSVDCEKRRISVPDKIVHRLGTVIIEGNGVCRNNAGMVDDIFNHIGLPGDIIFCHQNNCGNYFDGETNHAINLIYHEGTPYGIDTFNNCFLYRFDYIFSLINLDPNINDNLLYKPYFEIIHGKRNREQVIEKLESIMSLIGKDGISFQEYQRIKADVAVKMDAHKDDLIDFHKEYKFLKREIINRI